MPTTSHHTQYHNTATCGWALMHKNNNKKNNNSNKPPTSPPLSMMIIMNTTTSINTTIHRILRLLVVLLLALFLPSSPRPVVAFFHPNALNHWEDNDYGIKVTGLTNTPGQSTSGDFDCDGLPDIAFGDPAANGNRGAVQILFGSVWVGAETRTFDLTNAPRYVGQFLGSAWGSTWR